MLGPHLTPEPSQAVPPPGSPPVPRGSSPHPPRLPPWPGLLHYGQSLGSWLFFQLFFHWFFYDKSHYTQKFQKHESVQKKVSLLPSGLLRSGMVIKQQILFPYFL